jgi:hypothetical protein
MHLFEHGPHGVVLAQNLPGASAWPSLLVTWLTRHGWMQPQSDPMPHFIGSSPRATSIQ